MSFDQQQFSARLRSLRAEKDVPQKTVADAIGVDPSSVSMWESADRMPGADSVAALSDYFGVSADFLLCLSDYRMGLPPDEYLVDEEKLAGILAARTRADLHALSEPVNVVTTSGKPLEELPGLSWAAKVPRRPRIVPLTELVRLRSDVTKAVREVARADRTSGDR